MNKITTGNIFLDLGFPPEEAADPARKTDLMIELERIMNRRKLNIGQAAARFGVANSVVKRLKAGDMDFFSIDLLIQMLERAGKEVQVIVSDKKRVHAA